MEKRLRPRLTYANVIATLALFLAVSGGAAYAASQLGKNTVGTTQLKRNAVTGVKVKDRSLLASDFKAGELPVGERGAQGVPGAPGATDVVVRYGSEGKPKNNEEDLSIARCLPGETVTGGGFDFLDPAPGNFEYTLLTNRPSIDATVEGVAAFPPPGEGSEATGWVVAMGNETGATFYFRAYVMCARP